MSEERLKVEAVGGTWRLTGGVEDFALVNEFLGYVADRNY